MERFQSLASLYERMREIRDKYKDGDFVNQKDNEFLLEAFLKYHPRGEEKIQDEEGTWFYVGKNPQGTRGFFFIRQDGEKDHIAFMKLGQNQEQDRRYTAKKAFRYEINSTKNAFKEKHRSKPGFVFDHLGNEVADSDVDIHHASPTFDSILKKFLDHKGLTLNSIETMPVGSGNDKQLRDRLIAKEFKDFHDSKCNLKIVEKNEHRNMPKF